MSSPHQRTLPATGRLSPHRVRRRVVLPAPLAPSTMRASPGFRAKPRPANRRRSPRSQVRSTASRRQDGLSGPGVMESGGTACKKDAYC